MTLTGLYGQHCAEAEKISARAAMRTDAVGILSMMGSGASKRGTSTIIVHVLIE
jgi:hypothetical protein